jgi:hypothetical protein
VLVGALAALLVVMLPWWRDGVDPATGASRLLRDAPQHLVEATGRALPPGARVLVNQEWASWFEYALPEMPVFVDSRIELFTARTWTDYFEVVDAGDGWSRILDRWRVDAVVLQRDDELVPSIEASPEWRRVYVDRSGTLYVRT